MNDRKLVHALKRKQRDALDRTDNTRVFTIHAEARSVKVFRAAAR